MKKVLVVSAHPDDLEISCSGTLKRLQDQGYSIVSVVAVKPSGEANPNRTQSIVRAELENSYRSSGFELRMFDTDLHPNLRPCLIADNITMTRISKLLEPCDIAIIPNPQDSHQDHRATYHLVYPVLAKMAKEIWLMDSYPYSLRYKENTANLFYNISGEPWLFKQRLLECYPSALSASQVADIRLCNHYNGLRSGSELAEAFTIVQKNVN
jgi:LmbE family N-acetylglucosaminyl deacetylase